MKNKVTLYFAFLLIVVSAFSFAGCSKLVGPSDQDVINAINETGMFKGGFGELTLQSPITILEKGNRAKDGSWPVKVKVVFTAYVSKDKVSAPLERTLVFNMHKIKDNAGKTAWKASAQGS